MENRKEIGWKSDENRVKNRKEIGWKIGWKAGRKPGEKSEGNWMKKGVGM